MPWPTWDQAAVAAVALAVLALTTRRSARAGLRTVSAFAQETALISFLYMLWRLARQLPLVQEEGAYERGRQIYRLQEALHLPSERSMERVAMAHGWLAEWTVTYYATVHVPSLLLFLLWVWVRHRDVYPRWRNTLALTTGFCLFIRFVRVAPPRLLPEYGFVDLPAQLGRDIYGPLGTGASDQFAAMPSIHVAWAAIVGFGIFSLARGRWRWLGPFHLAATLWAVMATANHWWLDGLAGIALVGLSWWIDGTVRRIAARRRGDGDEGGPAASPADGATTGEQLPAVV